MANAVLRGRQGTIGEKHSTREPRDIRRVSGKKQFYEGVKRKQYHESVSRHVCLQLPLVLFNALYCTYIKSILTVCTVVLIVGTVSTVAS